MNRETETEYFSFNIKPTVDGVYKVKHLEWRRPMFSLWKNEQWHFSHANADHAEKEKARSILLYERGAVGWCGVVEKPEWV